MLSRFGMDTYKDPLHSDLLSLHVAYLLVVGTVLLVLNLAIEYGCFDSLIARLVLNLRTWTPRAKQRGDVRKPTNHVI